MFNLETQSLVPKNKLNTFIEWFASLVMGVRQSQEPNQKNVILAMEKDQ